MTSKSFQSNSLNLADIAEAIVDCEHKTAPVQSWGIPSIRTTNILNGRLDLENANKVSEETYALWTNRLEPREGDIILAREAPVGEVGIVPPGKRVCLGQRTVLIRPEEGRVIGRYLLYLLITDSVRHEMISRAEGSTVQHLNMSDIRALRIPPLPSLPEQRAIAHILGTLDDKIENNRRMNETLEAMAQALFKSWFVDFDPVRAKMEGRQPVGMDSETAALFPDRLVDSEIGEIPEGWGIGTLGDVAQHPRRTVQPGQMDPTTPYIALEHMPRRCIALNDWGFADGLESNKFQFQKREILFGKLRPYFHKVGVAPVDGVCSTDIVVVTPRKEEWFGFVLGHVSSDEFVDYTNAGSTGTKMPRTSWGEMARYPVSLPPESLASSFTNQIRSMKNHIITSIHEYRTLSELRDVLLPQLLSGQLLVEPLPETMPTNGSNDSPCDKRMRL